MCEHSEGETELRGLQELVVSHLDMVAELCMITDTQVLLLKDPSCSRKLKAELARLQKEELLAVKIVDKPNLHRLRELVFLTLRMVGHATLVGELSLE